MGGWSIVLPPVNRPLLPPPSTVLVDPTQCVQQPGLIEGWLVVSECVHFDHATITIAGEVLVGTQEQLTCSMSNSAMKSDIARMVMSGIMEDPLGLSVLRDYL